MKKAAKSKVTSDVVLTRTNESWPTGQNLKKVHAADLSKAYPRLFDKRLSGNQRFDMITQKQWQDYLDGLECALCRKPGGKCKCKPTDYSSED